ncbi:L-seryl-tRNA selenium transferase [[Clostridium] sordellii ATCC 9714]|nr:L-seryl-tRNA selenium transferase [[Clostridium] sordellii ATCC 9714] [Paeniclostridium sordellii ATCC 9714]
MNKRELFAQLPSVDEVLNQEKIIDALNEYPRNILLEAIREAIEEKRREIVDLNQCDFDKFEISIEKIVLNVINKCNIKYSLSLKKVINGTGTVLHTNLGRSLLSESIKEELWEAASRYSNLEYDIDKGQRVLDIHILQKL